MLALRQIAIGLKPGLDLILLSKTSGRFADEPFENDAHVLDVLEAAEFSDFLEREVRFDEQLADLGDLDAADFSLGGTAQTASEFLLQLTARGKGGL